MYFDYGNGGSSGHDRPALSRLESRVLIAPGTDLGGSSGTGASADNLTKKNPTVPYIRGAGKDTAGFMGQIRSDFLETEGVCPIEIGLAEGEHQCHIRLSCAQEPEVLKAEYVYYLKQTNQIVLDTTKKFISQQFGDAIKSLSS